MMQFRILTQCMEQWKLFCTLQKYYREMQLKLYTARFIHNTRLKYRVFKTLRDVRRNALFVRKRLHFSGWKDYLAHCGTRKTRYQKVVLFQAWKNIVEVTKISKNILSSSLSTWRMDVLFKRQRKMLLQRLLTRNVLKRYISQWHYIAIYTPGECCKYFTKKKFFKRWNVNATAREIKRQHSILALFRDRALSPIVATSPTIPKSHAVKKYGRKPRGPKVKVKPRNSPSALVERRLNIVYM